jgi:hypothetical protein
VPERPSAELTRILESARRLAWTSQADAARAEEINLVDNFFRARLTGHPAIRVYIDRLQHT